MARDAHALQVYGIPRDRRKVLRKIAKKKGFNSMSEMVRKYIDRVISTEEAEEKKSATT